MSQTFAHRLSIHEIAILWAAEGNSPLNEKDIATLLLTAVRHGEFQFPIRTGSSTKTHPNVDARLKAEIETFTIEGRPVTASDVEKFFRSTNAERVERDTFISIDGLRRWCDQEDTNKAITLRNLVRPTFLPGLAKQAPESDEVESYEPEETRRLRKPAKQMHDRWVDRARELRRKDPGRSLSDIARLIHGEEWKAPDEQTKGQVRASETIRRVLTERREEWKLSD